MSTVLEQPALFRDLEGRPDHPMHIANICTAFVKDGFERYISFIDADTIKKHPETCPEPECECKLAAVGFRSEHLKSYRVYAYGSICGRVAFEF